MADQPSEDTKKPTEVKPKDTKSKLKEVSYDGYSFKVDLDAIDDVEVLELIDSIENNGQTGKIISFLKNLIGDDGYAEMKQYFTKKDDRFRLNKLIGVYEAIFKNLDPKDLPF